MNVEENIKFPLTMFTDQTEEESPGFRRPPPHQEAPPTDQTKRDSSPEPRRRSRRGSTPRSLDPRAAAVALALYQKNPFSP